MNLFNMDFTKLNLLHVSKLPNNLKYSTCCRMYNMTLWRIHINVCNYHNQAFKTSYDTIVSTQLSHEQVNFYQSKINNLVYWHHHIWYYQSNLWKHDIINKIQIMISRCEGIYLFVISNLHDAPKKNPNDIPEKHAWSTLGNVGEKPVKH